MRKRSLYILLSIVAVAIVGAFILDADSSALAQSDTEPVVSPQDDTERVIEVTGQGSVSARPDMAIVRLGVETEADTATAALETNSVRMSDLISATLAAEVAEDDIRTTGLRLQPVYEQQEVSEGPEPPAGPPAVIGYRATNNLAITIRDVNDVGLVIDAAIAAGGNTIQNIRFVISDRAELHAAARAAAMADAIAKAEQLTSAAGAELGEVLTIRESGGPFPAGGGAEAAVTADRAVPVAPGTQEIQTTVRVSWSITSS